MKQAKVVPFVAILFLAALATAQIPSQTQQALHPDIIALQTSSDLIPKDLGFTALGEITFNLVNRGEVGINTKTKTAAAQAGAQSSSSGPPIRVDMYMGGTLVHSVYQPSLGGKQTKNFAVKPQSNMPKCKESRDLKVIIDPQNVIQELHDDNNALALKARRPCPDLAIKSIKRDKEGVLGETYRPKVTIVNLGDAPSPSHKVWAGALSSAPGITGWPQFVPSETIPALAPGETTSFKVGGSVLSVDNCWVRIIVDPEFRIEESDETNNRKDEKL